MLTWVLAENPPRHSLRNPEGTLIGNDVVRVGGVMLILSITMLAPTSEELGRIW
jgi:hypothetical protein